MKETVAEKTLDVRDMVPRERHPRIFGAFETLKPGESFILVNDHEPRPLLYQFQAEHDGEFEWWPLESGPEVFRVMIARREKKTAVRTITDYLQSDHRRLDGIFDGFKEALSDKRWDDALTAFKEFSLGLRRHIRVEEDILFPVFEEKTGMHEGGPTFVMKMEHKDIQELLDKILSATASKDERTADEAAGLLLNILTDHNMKEEHILYPESDIFITDAEKKEVIKKAQAL